eukprot:m.1637990 g.1637990  ORF g.1637990 m.1637990 type:complete len:618 (-) comp26546_c0_seq1:873-2726(-)
MGFPVRNLTKILQQKMARTMRAILAALCIAWCCDGVDADVVNGWKQVAARSEFRNEQLSFAVALHPQNTDVVEEKLARISDPDHESYGQFLSAAEVIALTATDAKTVLKVKNALAPATCKNAGDSLKCTATVREIEQVFKCEMSVFEHTITNKRVIRTVESLSLPDDVIFVSGLTELFEPRQDFFREYSADVDAKVDPMVVPDTIRSLYNISTFLGHPNTTSSVAEFPGSNNESPADLLSFGNYTGLPQLTIAKHVGPPNDPQADSTEATLDIQYVKGVAPTVPAWVWNSDNWMFELARDLINATARPAVVSVSYAWNEAKQCGGIANGQCTGGESSAQYVNRTNFEFQKVGLLGTTVVVASGDSGAHGRTDKVCLFNAKMHPNFPAASPYVLSVGGTQLVSPIGTAGATSPICTSGEFANNCAMSGTEVVASTSLKFSPRARITSGGGFSDVAARPAYQAAVVSNYLQNTSGAPKNTNLFNVNGRGYPDVSALSHNYYIEIGGKHGSVDGTSAATPVLAGLVALINSQRALQGRPAVGFVNPLLYKVYDMTQGKAFQDITEGSNDCTESGCECKTGFAATQGWDAATGLGTPNLGRILKAIEEIDVRREQRYNLRV